MVRWAEQTENAGVVIAADKQQEFYAWWFLQHFRRHNTAPVILFDSGIGESVLSACREIKDVTVKKAPKGLGWFVKPYAVLNSPFKKTVWLDVDCRVRANIVRLFSATGEYLMLRRDEPYLNTEWKNKLYEGEVMYNSGVIAVSHGHPAIVQWAVACKLGIHWCRGDQEMLSRVLHLYKDSKNWTVTELPRGYNNLRLEEADENAVVQHLTGPAGKREIVKEIRDWKAARKQ